jgi:hypothetical protein
VARRELDATIWTLKVKLVFGLHAGGPWKATLEIESSATLEDLHVAVQSAIQFDDDHMYMFYVARTHRIRDRTAFEQEDGTLQNTTLAELFPLPPDRKLFYWFDFGDDWKFSIGRARAAPQVAGKSRPLLCSRSLFGVLQPPECFDACEIREITPDPARPNAIWWLPDAELAESDDRRHH